MVSGRLTSSIYKIANDANGSIIWQLSGYGGKAAGYGDFYTGKGANFEWQHHVRWRSESEISIFDNGASSHIVNEKASRGLRLAIDTTTPGNYSASLIQELVNWANPLAIARGSVQYLSNGNYWVAYGIVPLFAEYSPEGEVISQYQVSPLGSRVNSYRAYKRNFTTHPTTIPDIALKDNAVYMSWNGATEVKQWSVLSGASPTEMFEVGIVVKTGFETKFTFLEPFDPYTNFTRVDALDVNGRTLKSSIVIGGSSLPTASDVREAQRRLNIYSD